MPKYQQDNTRPELKLMSKSLDGPLNKEYIKKLISESTTKADNIDYTSQYYKRQAEEKKVENEHRKVREKEMFRVDGNILNEFVLPGKPELKSVVPLGDLSSRRSAINNRKPKQVVVEDEDEVKAELTTFSGTLQRVTTVGLNTDDIPELGGTNPLSPARQGTAAVGVGDKQQQPLSDLDEVAKIMSTIHTGDEAINFFARYGSQTPVRPSLSSSCHIIIIIIISHYHHRSHSPSPTSSQEWH